MSDHAARGETAENLHAEHLRKLRENHSLYCRAALKIQTKAGILTSLNLNFAQQVVEQRIEAQLAESGRVRALILKARQEGISTYCGSRIYKGTTLWSNRRALVLADKLDRAAEIFGIYERFDRELTDALRPPARSTVRRRELSWATDSRITVETAGDPDAGRGSTLHYLHASELAMWPRAEETWIALMQAVPADSAEVYVESTAKGIGNLFYNLWQQAESGESDWLPIFLPWWIHDEYQKTPTPEEEADIRTTADPWERMALDEGIEWEGQRYQLTVEQIAWRRSKVRDDFLGDERLFRQEYPATAREAFVTSGDGFFDPMALEAYELRQRNPLFRATFVPDEEGWKLQRSERGYVRIWELPDPHGHYVIAADTAEGKLAAATDASLTDAAAEHGGRDFSSADVLKVSEVIQGVRTPCLRQVAQIHGRMAPEIFATQINAAALLYSCPTGMKTTRRIALTGIERNHSSGQTVIRELERFHNHPNLFTHRRMNIRQGAATRQLGWITDGTTRMPMLDNLAALIREGSIEILCPDTIREMFQFVRQEDGKPAAQEGAHDDRVISLAIACQMVLHHSDDPVGKMPDIEVFDSPTGMGYV